MNARLALVGEIGLLHLRPALEADVPRMVCLNARVGLIRGVLVQEPIGKLTTTLEGGIGKKNHPIRCGRARQQFGIDFHYSATR